MQQVCHTTMGIELSSEKLQFESQEGLLAAGRLTWLNLKHRGRKPRSEDVHMWSWWLMARKFRTIVPRLI